MSRFKRDDAGRFVVCEVTLPAAPRSRRRSPIRTCVELPRARHGIASPTVADVRDAVLAIRRRKGMVLDAADPDTRSVGSFFMNPVVPRHVHERVAARMPAIAGAGLSRLPTAV